MAQAQAQQLSTKDHNQFRQVVRHFESKQYKKGLKSAEQILKKNPNHADTQAMKALIMHSQGHTEEAFELAKVALKNNMKSHVTWHVYGLLWRGEKNFEEAIKAYKFALRIEPDSAPIQRDLAHLQIQMRDYEGYVESRKTMLTAKPAFRQNWTALAIAHHLNGNYEEAENVLTTYEDTIKQRVPRTDLEHWEAVLYKNYVIAESGNVDKALAHLDAVGKKSPDVQGVMEMRADYLLRLEKMTEAEAAYLALIRRNPENSAYFDGWSKAKGLQDASPADAKKEYEQLSAQFPKADLLRRRPLDSLSGDSFREAADAYLLRILRRGIPSTFANIKQLYIDSEKLKIIQELVLSYDAGKVPEGGETATDKEQENFKWSVPYFLAQHYNFAASRDLQKALSYADKCLEIDPKSVDFHAVKARTYKYLGNTARAAELMTTAQSLDLKDRAINTKCAKYTLRNNQPDAALEMASKFTQNKGAAGPLGDLLDMQCVWFLTEDGQAYMRARKLGLALKRFHQILHIFDVWQEDQFDFHNFSLRKGMIRAYIDMLRWEDRLRDHPFFARMAISAVQCYIMLHDNPDLVHGPILNGTANLPEAERKKALKKAKREQEKLEKAEADKKALAKASKPVPKADQDEVKKEDTDPLGKTLVESKTPLEDAMKFLTPLLEHSSTNVEAQKVGFELYIRRKKYLLATKSLLKLKSLASQDPDCTFFAYQLKGALNKMDEKVAAMVKELAGDSLNLDKSLDSWRSEQEKQLASRVQTIDDLSESLQRLSVWGSDASAISNFKSEAKKSWPEAAVLA